MSLLIPDGIRMVLHVHLDLVGGIAGDMFVAAMADARPELVDGLVVALKALAPPSHVSYGLESYSDGVLNGTRFKTSEGRDGSAHTPFPLLCDRIRASNLSAPVVSRALDIFTLLGEAEGAVHGVSLEEVNFHEVGAWDSVIDVVGAAYFIEALDATWSCGAIPQGGGLVNTAHGALPLPVPAVTALLEGFEFFEDDLEGERVTPTGAAILRHLIVGSQRNCDRRQLLTAGNGFGTRELVGKSNVLRALVFNNLEKQKVTDEVGVIEFGIDDQSPEDLAYALELVRVSDGVIDVVQWPVFGKKGRMGAHIQILVVPLHLDDVVDICLSETTTIGLRWRLEARRMLTRETVTVDGASGPIRVKLVELPDGAPSAKAENDDLAGIIGGREGRRAARSKAEEEAVGRKK